MTASDGVLKAGLLYKRNSKLLWWRPRWSSLVYTLTRRELVAFDSSTGLPAGSIPLAGLRLDIKTVVPMEDGLEWRFILRSGLHTIHLAAPTKAERIEWIEALKSILLPSDVRESCDTRSSASTTLRSTTSPHPPIQLRSTMGEIKSAKKIQDTRSHRRRRRASQC
ncbi:unnamed protein product [Aphanomyces euteiches]|uniref:PH domain-containing protein n=1 Tax=Aphanomyces euteiches TaxID=100861 RepID=A0A6G0WH72_9STRA|nr:hypothetical protein Ae201684_015272 [Aphanomyces euteiches]KAH9071958.1 hypothetical protein Ae201684P_021095 [Aphanomyces euteiches]KAH9111598.1 hypothetical protein AeMF1_013905 [Aphanomyces euteiches]KAH9119773.1 hypothetical protein LEN26_011444 [Aphanomyces euteiches]KAH9143709.1 hypothetical protein AeRB84_012319 [Aphanomyces euteiches]